MIVGFSVFTSWFILHFRYKVPIIKAGEIALYSVVTNFIELLANSGEEKIEFSYDDTRTAIAVLYYRVILVDGRIRREELDHFRTVLGETLNVSEDELLLFEDRVLAQIQSERSLFPFTSIVKKLPVSKRLEILEHMRQISISDHELHEFEINLVERTAELLGIENWHATRSSDPGRE